MRESTPDQNPRHTKKGAALIHQAVQCCENLVRESELGCRRWAAQRIPAGVCYRRIPVSAQAAMPPSFDHAAQTASC
jgi:hypothetical protein